MNDFKKIVNDSKPIANQIFNAIFNNERGNLQYFAENMVKGKKQENRMLSEESTLEDYVPEQKEEEQEKSKLEYVEEKGNVENAKAKSTQDFKISIDENSIMQGIIFSEILGPPRCKNRRRSSRSDTR